jgi:SSS family solute:Na+ symporter
VDTLAQGLRLRLDAVDYALLALYLVTVLGVGVAARRPVRTSIDFFRSGRSLPAWDAERV